jgi:CRISPR-associated protein Cas5t
VNPVRVLKVEAQGLTASFRYAHFLVGRQPTFRMPPPATIYGHVCSAVGEFIDRASLRFAYVFTYEGIGDDMEFMHMASVSRGKMPGAPHLARNLDVTINPTAREVLLFPHLTLYLDADDAIERLYHAFRAPRYAVVLGRSQDLMSYRSVEIIELEQSPRAYFEDMLLPWSYRPRLPTGVGVNMPRFIDPADRRRVLWSPFVVLQERLILADPDGPSGARAVARDDPDERVWIDPTAPRYRDRHRAVVWLDFQGGGAGELDFLSSAGAPVG